MDTELTNNEQGVKSTTTLSSYFTLNANRLSLDQIFVFLLLFGGTISQDLLEAAMEDGHWIR